MKKFNLAKLLSLVLVFTLLMGTFAVLPASAAEAPSIEIVSNNVLYGEKLHLMYAVETANAPAGAEIVVTISDGTNTYATEETEDDTYGTVYVSKVGVAAQNIATVYTATATLKDGDTVLATDTQTYSVLEYLYTRLLVSTEKTEAQVAMYNSLLDYAAKAEAVLCADRETKIGDYVFVTAKDATVNGETALTVKKGTKVTPVLDAGFTVPSGKTLVWNVTPYGGATVTYTAEEVVNGIEVSGNVNIAAALIDDGSLDENAIKTYAYEFTSKVFSANGAQKLGDVTWTLAGDGGYWGTDSSGRGHQFGSGNNPYKSMTLTSSERFGNVTKVVINTASGSGESTTIKVTVGNTPIGEVKALSTSATEYEFTSTEPLSGPIVIEYTQNASKAIYIKSISVNPAAVEEPEPEPEPEEPETPSTGGYVYKLVTNLSQLKVGDEIVIVAAGNNNYALSTTQNGNNRGRANVTKSGDTVTFGSDVQVITLENGTSSGTFAFNVGNGYLNAAGGTGSNNHLKTNASLILSASWNITISASGIATIKTADTTVARGWMRYNSSSSIFSCYGSGQADICIYVKTAV